MSLNLSKLATLWLKPSVARASAVRLGEGLRGFSGIWARFSGRFGKLGTLWQKPSFVRPWLELMSFNSSDSTVLPSVSLHFHVIHLTAVAFFMAA